LPSIRVALFFEHAVNTLAGSDLRHLQEKRQEADFLLSVYSQLQLFQKKERRRRLQGNRQIVGDVQPVADASISTPTVV
jgi:hypothetical protein